MILPKPAKREPKPRKRIPRTARIRQTSLGRHAKLVKTADGLWALIIRSTSRKCIRCKWQLTAQADHAVTRVHWTLRWDLRNGLPLCAGCHRAVTSDVHEHARIAVEHMGEALWEQLNVVKHYQVKVDPSLMIVALRHEARRRGLEAEAVRRGLMGEP